MPSPAPSAPILEQQIEQLRQSLRPGQRDMADWQSGPLAVAAVPGAGKSHGMAAAAAITIARHRLDFTRQLVLVTFTRSAATHLKQKVRQFLKDLNLPQSGFMVQTLHSLALNIASRHPQHTGLDLTNATLISPYQSHRLIRQCVEQWIQSQPNLYRLLLETGTITGEEGDRLRRQSALRTEILPDLARTTIRTAKSSGLTPDDLRHLGDRIPDDLPILAIAAGLYAQYNTLLHQSGWMDYDDMILAALRVLTNPAILATWQDQIFAVFEDEAQDSTPLQSQLLELLATDATHPNQRNLVRVGDPNQAINSTFTPADPVYFRTFCQACDRDRHLAEMSQSARSCQPILDVANFMLTWANRSPLVGTEQPFTPQTIHPVPRSENLTNPSPIGRGVELYFPTDIYQSVNLIGQRALQLWADQPDLSVVVLVRENKQARFLVEVLRDPNRYGLSVDLNAHEIPIVDVGASDRRSHVPPEMLTLLQFLARPHAPDYFKAALHVLAKRQLIPAIDFNPLAHEPEQLLYPSPLAPESSEAMIQIRQVCGSFLDARWGLPLSQLIAYLALELNYDAVELATADKLASRLLQQLGDRATLAESIDTLQDIVSTEHFDPVNLEGDDSYYTRPRQLTLMTMHKAKGLDWDVVFLPFLHESVLPGHLRVPIPAQFLGDYTLAEVARSQICTNRHNPERLLTASEAWHQAKNLKAAEEFRLLYVAMTRAKQLLWLSAAQTAPFYWGSFNWERQPTLDTLKPCPVLPALKKQFPQIFVPLRRSLYP